MTRFGTKAVFVLIGVGFGRRGRGFVAGEPKDQSEQFRPAILLDLSDYDARDASLLSFRFSELSQPI